MTAETRLVLRNDLAELPRANGALERFCKDNGVDDEALFDLTVAFEEIFTNIVRHAYDGDGRHEIDVVMGRRGDVLTLSIADDGRPFDPSSAPQPRLDVAAEQRAVGGLGIHLVRNLMDEMEYTRQGGHNVTTLSKKIAAG